LNAKYSISRQLTAFGRPGAFHFLTGLAMITG